MAVDPVTWGRKAKAEWTNTLGALAMITFFPALIIFYWITLESHGGSVTAAFRSLAASNNPWSIFWARCPQPSMTAAVGYAAWLVFQIVLYFALPGPNCLGQRTPGGNILTYRCNGLAGYIFTHGLAGVLTWFGVINPAIIANNWEGLLVAVNVYGMALALAAQVKGYMSPSYPEDQKLTGSFLFDFLAGVELNPRIGSFDIKWFHNARPGIIAWTLIDLSWAAYQYQTFGFITKSMIAAIFLHGLYVVDLFYNESWYTRTPDISHDHFGWYLAWGDVVFLPTFYTLQSQYLARYPIRLTSLETALILVLGVAGYLSFRSANWQRDHVRQLRNSAIVWGRPATYIPCTYFTKDGKQHDSLLLTCGWWGLARHSNYTADLVLSWAMCATCGFKHILPWSYFFFMLFFLHHRMQRDDRRCRNKYGVKWEEYCAKVPYQLIPGVY